MFFYAFLPKLLNMSLTASVAIVFVLLLRLLLRRAPKVISYALWGIVLFRLLCPVSIQSNLSLFGLLDTPAKESGALTSSIEYVPGNMVYTGHPAAALPAPGAQDAADIAQPQGQERPAADPLDTQMVFAFCVWMAGVLGMGVYATVSYVRLRRRLLTAIHLRDNIWAADGIPSPFVMGLFRPKIYLPAAMDGGKQSYIILHEQHHIRRLDHIVKTIAFVTLCIHWFNPLVWVAFILAGKDMEMSCDEAVVKKMGDGILADYTASLLSLATGQHIIAGTPLAFGEGDTKGRIRNLANWKKPAFWVVLVAVIACLALAVCLLTNPARPREISGWGGNVTDMEPQRIIEQIAAIDRLGNISVHTNANDSAIRLTSNFDIEDTQAIRFFYRKGENTYSSQLAFDRDGAYKVTEPSKWPEQSSVYTLQSYLEALKYLPQEDIRALSPDAGYYLLVLRDGGDPGDYARSITYTPGGTGPTDGWLIHIEIRPMYEADGAADPGTDDGVIHVFYGPGDHAAASGVTAWFDYWQNPSADRYAQKEMTQQAFPGVTFRCDGIQIAASKGGEDKVLIHGMPIWNGYFADLTGDGLPDICATVSFGSGMVDNRIIIYDYANAVSYELEDRGFHDYSLSLQGGKLIVTKRVYNSSTVVETGYLCYVDGTVTILPTQAHSSASQDLEQAISKAILDHYASNEPDGLLHVESHILLSSESVSGTPLIGQDTHTKKTVVYLLVRHMEYSTYDGQLEERGGSYVPTAITFSIDGNGAYILEEYWEPRDGGYYTDDIRKKFPEPAAEEVFHKAQEDIEALRIQCYQKALAYLKMNGTLDAQIERLLGVIMSSPLEASNPGAYISAHEAEYQKLLSYGEFTLRYCFEQFLQGGQTDLRGHIMAILCREIAFNWGEAVLMWDSDPPIEAQAWFDAFLDHALSLAGQYTDQELKKHYPAAYLLLQMVAEGDYAMPN